MHIAMHAHLQHRDRSPVPLEVPAYVPLRAAHSQMHSHTHSQMR